MLNTLGSLHKQSLLFRDVDTLTRLKESLNDDAYESSIMHATGIPPHVKILREIKNLNINVKNAIDASLNNPYHLSVTPKYVK